LGREKGSTSEGSEIGGEKGIYLALQSLGPIGHAVIKFDPK
jgi:hypothetical protein